VPKKVRGGFGKDFVDLRILWIELTMVGNLCQKDEGRRKEKRVRKEVRIKLASSLILQ
jgi:hypothetical protein